MAFSVGLKNQNWLTLTADDIRAGATMVGDHNPVHHDEEFARTTRFGGLFASGAHTSALLAGMVSKGWPKLETPGAPRGYVGADYFVQFKAPCMANHRLRFEWVVTAIEPTSRGQIIKLDGSVTDEDTGQLTLTGKMTMFGYFD